MTPADLAAVAELAGEGHGAPTIARRLGLRQSAVSAALRRLDHRGRPGGVPDGREGRIVVRVSADEEAEIRAWARGPVGPAIRAIVMDVVRGSAPMADAKEK